jgi:hypothetical protein
MRSMDGWTPEACFEVQLTGGVRPAVNYCGSAYCTRNLHNYAE